MQTAQKGMCYYMTSNRQRVSGTQCMFSLKASVICGGGGFGSWTDTGWVGLREECDSMITSYG